MSPSALSWIQTLTRLTNGRRPLISCSIRDCRRQRYVLLFTTYRDFIFFVKGGGDRKVKFKRYFPAICGINVTKFTDENIKKNCTMILRIFACSVRPRVCDISILQRQRKAKAERHRNA